MGPPYLDRANPEINEEPVTQKSTPQTACLQILNNQA